MLGLALKVVNNNRFSLSGDMTGVSHCRMTRTSSVYMKAYCCSHVQMLPQCVVITVKV